jgi:hypothetical protein
MDVEPDGIFSPALQASYTRKIFIKAGIAYGAIFGLSFALLNWGLDGLVLDTNGAAQAWIKLWVGLPVVLLVCALAGWLGALSSNGIIAVTVWAVTGAILGVISGHVPFEGRNLAVWLLEPRLWGEEIYAYNNSAAVRTTLIVIINIAFGFFIGFVESLAVQWAWDRKKPVGRLSLGSWFTLCVAVLMAILPALIINGLMNQPLRTSQVAVGEILNAISHGDIDESMGPSYRSLKPYLEYLTPNYRTYFVTFGSETGTWYSAYVDIAFDNGLVLRCAASGNSVLYCENFNARLLGWVDDLVRSGMYAERPWEEAKVKRLSVDDTVIAWLSAHSEQFSEDYTVMRDGQEGGWVFITVEFDTGFRMSCRLRQAAPTIIDQCIEGN